MEFMTDEFTKLVKKCADREENQVIFNASSSHALVLFEELLDMAARKLLPVKIFSGKFDTAIYDKLVSKISQVLEKGVKVELLSEENNSVLAGNKFVEAVKSKNGDAVKYLKNDMSDLKHFILVGKSAFRFETDNEKKTAQANFNDPITGAMIDRRFSELWESANA